MTKDFADLAAKFQGDVEPARLERLALSLGLSSIGLRRFGVGWAEDHRAWAFPMLDCEGCVIGIRLRTAEGKKFAVRGGRDGLFLPSRLDTEGLLVITEGPSDAVAISDLGLQAIGRPSCTGATRLLVEFVRGRKPREVVVISDNDRPTQDGRRPGLDGATALCLHLSRVCRSVKLAAPPPEFKDAREWARAGVTRTGILRHFDTLDAMRISVRVSAPKEVTHHA